MFTGIIEQTGTLRAKRRNRITVEVVGQKARLGDSISINGICLTVVDIKRFQRKMLFDFDISEETFLKTTLDKWKLGQTVNIEPALKLTDSLGGHLVQGHVDGTAKLTKIVRKKASSNYWFEANRDMLKSVVEKGSVTIDGVSLTAMGVGREKFSVALIPFTLKHTTLGSLKKGDNVNLEMDLIGKYVSKYLKK